MTATSRFKIALIALIAAFIATFGAEYFGSVAFGQPAGSGSGSGSEVAAAPGSGSATTPAPAPSSTPADRLHDPESAPAAAWDDVRAAKKAGWAVLVFAVLVMLTRLAAHIGKEVSWLAALGKGKTAVVIAAVAAVAAACYNALAAGGAWVAALAAAVVAIGHYFDASKPTGTTT